MWKPKEVMKQRQNKSHNHTTTSLLHNSLFPCFRTPRLNSCGLVEHRIDPLHSEERRHKEARVHNLGT